MSSEAGPSRSRRLVAELLSTRPGTDADKAALLRLVDEMEEAGLLFTRWSTDGPGPSGVRLEFQDHRDTLSASLSELQDCADRLAAGHTAPWRTLRLPEGSTPSREGRGTGRTRGMQQGHPHQDP